MAALDEAEGVQHGPEDAVYQAQREAGDRPRDVDEEVEGGEESDLEDTADLGKIDEQRRSCYCRRVTE